MLLVMQSRDGIRVEFELYFEEYSRVGYIILAATVTLLCCAKPAWIYSSSQSPDGTAIGDDNKADPPDAKPRHGFPRFVVNLKLVPVQGQWGRANMCAL